MTTSSAITAFVGLWAMLCILGWGVCLVLAFQHWRDESRDRYLAFGLVLGASPFVAALIWFGMLQWVLGLETLDGRSGRIASGIAVTLLPAAGLILAAILRAGGPSTPAWKTKLTVVAAAPFVVGVLYSTTWFSIERDRALANARETADAPAARRSADTSALVRVGDPAPGFALLTDTGADFKLEEHSGKLVLLNFYASWCGPCIAELPGLEEIWKTHRDHNEFSMLVIGREETPEKVAAFREKYGFTFPMAADEERKVFSQFATESIPRTFLVSRDGTILAAVLGYREEELKELQQLLAEELSK